MSEFLLPPQMQSVSIRNGKEYVPNRQGKIQVDNPRHVAELQLASQNGEAIQAIGHTFQGVPGKTCSKCQFTAFLFTKVCPRCQNAHFINEGEK